MKPPLLFMEESETRRDTAVCLRVLVVEDEAAVRLLIVMHLEESGFCVIEAASAEQAIARLTEDDAAVVFSDIEMPGAMDGVDLARWIARERPRSKVLLTSGRPVPAAVRAWPFVAKPYRLERVEQQLRQMLAA